MTWHTILAEVLLVAFAVQPQAGQPVSPMELQRRIMFANKQFGSRSTVGSQTDRGTVYIALGPPDRIENHDGAENPNNLPEFLTYPSQAWVYHTIPGIGGEVRILFVDTSLDSAYRMTPPPRTEDPKFDAEARRRFKLVQMRIQEFKKAAKRLPKGR